MMNLIVFTKHGDLRQLNLGRPLALGFMLGSALLVAGGFFAAGYGAATWFSQPQSGPHTWRTRLAEQAKEVSRAKQMAQVNIDALTAKVGELQAHVIRLDALGQQLTRLAGIKRGEFNFNQPPASGGPDMSGPIEHMPLPDFLSNLDQLSRQIKNSEQQLTVLENLLLDRNVQRMVQPSGAPVLAGYESSPFGMRIDPFTGELSFHPGIDFAGVMGEPLYSVAPGVVTWAGPRSGYGNLVEIDHGNGYATRYGHAEKILVHVGQVVKKGEEIALMGSTGRSTGPHVHFEVLYNGKPVDPTRFVNAAGQTRMAALSRSMD